MQRASKQDIAPETPPVPGGNKKQSQSVAQRWLTALIAIPIVLLFGWFGGWMAFIATALVVIVATLELHTMLGHAGYRPLTWLSLALSLLFLIAAMFPQQQLLILEGGLTAALLISFTWLFQRKNLDGSLIDWALTVAIAIYLGWPSSCFLLLRGSEPVILHGLTLTIPPGAWWLLFTLLGVWGCDSVAFFTGRLWGRHKLAPTVSPGKTWEGFVGGLACAVLAAILLTVLPLGIPWFLGILLGILLGVAAVLGDLAESLIKRQTHVKDSGQIIPGHGGILDRIDSLLFAVMVVFIFSQLIH